MTTMTKLKNTTYSQIIFNQTLAGKTLTNMQNYVQYNMTCFIQRIRDLNAAGVIIQNLTVKQNGKRFKRYWVDQPSSSSYHEVTL